MKFFSEENTNFVNNVSSWKQAIKLGVNQLVLNNSATDALYDEIIKVTEQYGAYYIVTPKVALAHAAPGPYCLKPDISAIFLKNEVSFNNTDNGQVKIVITLSCPDANSHFRYLKKFANIFSDNKIINDIFNVDNYQALVELLGEMNNV